MEMVKLQFVLQDILKTNYENNISIFDYEGIDFESVLNYCKKLVLMNQMIKLN